MEMVATKEELEAKKWAGLVFIPNLPSDIGTLCDVFWSLKCHYARDGE